MNLRPFNVGADVVRPPAKERTLASFGCEAQPSDPAREPRSNLAGHIAS